MVSSVSRVDISVIVPAFNEAKRLPLFLAELTAYCKNSVYAYEIIIVDDGSKDNTCEAAESFKDCFPALSVVRNPVNKGKGYSVKRGLAQAKGNISLYMDADGSVKPETIEKTLPLILTQRYDIVVGSRILKGKGQVLKTRLHRRLIGKLFNLSLSLLLSGRINIKDTQCGFKVFKKEAADFLFPLITINGFGFDMELLVLACQNGFRVKEIPVSWEHITGSKINLFKDSWKMFFDILNIKQKYLRQGLNRKVYDVKKLVDFYNYSPQYGAVSDDIIASQYGLKDGVIISPSRHYFFYQELLGFIRSRIQEQAFLADIGCGMGILAEVCRDKLAKYVGMDLAFERVKQARLRVPDKKCFWVVGDAQNLPFKSGSFNNVVSLEVIEHLPDTKAYLKEINRILTPGGNFILSTPGSLFYNSDSGRLYRDQHIYQFNLRVLKQKLRNSCFRPLSSRGVGFRLLLVIPVWLGSNLLKFIYIKIKRVDLRSGYNVPVSLEFDIVTHPWVNRMHFALKSKKIWYFFMRVAGAIGKIFPELSSTMVVECQK